MTRKRSLKFFRKRTHIKKIQPMKFYYYLLTYSKIYFSAHVSDQNMRCFENMVISQLIYRQGFCAEIYFNIFFSPYSLLKIPLSSADFHCLQNCSPKNGIICLLKWKNPSVPAQKTSLILSLKSEIYSFQPKILLKTIYRCSSAQIQRRIIYE